jgi:acyl-coenzyme A thioesterase PaaI-like protein
VSGFQPKVADFEERVRMSFDRQQMMHTIGASLARIEPGEVEIAMPIAPQFCQSTDSSMPGS